MPNNHKYCNAEIFILNESNINGRKVSLYAVSSSLSDIYFIDYEQTTKEIRRIFFDRNKAEAEKRYNAILLSVVKGKL